MCDSTLCIIGGNFTFSIGLDREISYNKINDGEVAGTEPGNIYWEGLI